jgi:hypothetical protein
MAKQDHILLAAVRLRTFTAEELIEQSRQKATTVRSWLTKSQRQGLIEMVATIKPIKRGPPQKRFSALPAARERALADGWVLAELARAQYEKGERHGFVEPPDVDPDSLLSEPCTLLETCLATFGENCSARNYDLLSPDDGLFEDWIRSCDEPDPQSYADVHGMRREILSRLRVVGRIIEDWERVGVNMPAPVISRYKTVHATARDPRAFLIAAGFHQACRLFVEKRQRSNQSPFAGIVAQVATLLAGHAIADAKSTIEQSVPGWRTTTVRRVPALRLFYGLDFAGRFDRWQAQPRDQPVSLHEWPSHRDIALVSLMVAQADDTVHRVPGTDEESKVSNVARAALSAAAQMSSWRGVALAISAMVRARASGALGADDAAYERLIARLAVALKGELDRIDRASYETRPSQEEELMLQGALWPALQAATYHPLRALITMPTRTGSAIATTEAHLRSRDVSKLDRRAGLSRGMRATLSLLPAQLSRPAKQADKLMVITEDLERFLN